MGCKVGVRKGGKYANGVVPQPGVVPQAPNIGIRPGGAYEAGAVPSDPSVMGFLKDRAQATISALTPKAALQPAVQGVTDNTGLTGQAVDAIRSHNEQLANLKNGAVAVKGPGTPTSDSIPVHISKDESVLPAATTAALGAGNIARLIEATNGVKPKIGVRLNGEHATGVVPENDAAYKAGQAVGKVVGGAAEEIGGAASTAGKLMTLPAKLVGAGVGAAANTVGQFARGAYGLSPTGFEQNMGIPPITEADHARAAASAARAKADAQPPVTARPAAPAPMARGVNRTVAPEVAAPIVPELPKFGVSGTGYVRNNQTGETQIFTPPPAAPAAKPADQANKTVLQLAQEHYQDMLKNNPNSTQFRDAQNALLAAQGQTGTMAEQKARASELEQKTAEQAKMIELQNKIENLNLPENERTAAREAYVRRLGTGAGKNPATEAALAIVKNPMSAPEDIEAANAHLRGVLSSGQGGQAPASGPAEGSKSTSGGKPIVFKNGKWEFA